MRGLTTSIFIPFSYLFYFWINNNRIVSNSIKVPCLISILTHIKLFNPDLSLCVSNEIRKRYYFSFINLFTVWFCCLYCSAYFTVIVEACQAHNNSSVLRFGTVASCTSNHRGVTNSSWRWLALHFQPSCMQLRSILIQRVTYVYLLFRRNVFKWAYLIGLYMEILFIV